MRTVRIRGGGPAGACAALAALREGAAAVVQERSHFPRHKVCGEFLSPEIVSVFEDLKIADEFHAAVPALIRRMRICIGSTVRTAPLPEVAFGLSRYALDHMLLTAARDRGAHIAECNAFEIDASGRGTEPLAGSGDRLFGFKTHFEGSTDDAVELYFGDRTYTGVNCVEAGSTNVCGLAPESLLKRIDFEPDELIARSPALRARLEPLRRTMKWHFTGPLTFRQRWAEDNAMLAGDALSFVDPFTGSGMLCAAVTGSLAGVHAARGRSIAEYRRACRAAIARPFLMSTVLRSLAGMPAAGLLLRFVPAAALFRWTRPR